MEIKSELEIELKYLKKIRLIMLDNKVFILEEIQVIDKMIKRIEIILSVLKE